MTRGRTIGVLTGLVLVAAAAVAGYKLMATRTAGATASAPVVPTARVTRGSLTLTVYLQGDLRATSQSNLTAPAVGGALRILTVAETGTPVEQGDPIMEFDPADQQYALEQAESELLEAEQEIIKRRAEIKAQEAQDKVTLMTSQFDVRRAELDAKMDQDLIAANEFKVRQAELVEATRNLERLGQDIKARAVTSKASLAVLEEKRTRAKMSAERARQNMDNLVLKAPMDGVVSVRENFDVGGGMFFDGMSMPTYRAGDTVYSGRPVIDIFDVRSMDIRARVNEQERANVSEGQTARVESDAVPGMSLPAKVSAVAGMGKPDSRWGPLRQFDVTLELKDPDPRLKPGTSVRVLVEGATIDNALLLPRQALFEIEGKPTVYLRSGAGPEAFTPKPIKVIHRTESRIAVEGIEAGAEVALIDPVAALRLSGASPAATPSPLGGKK
jgi:HlyD family secretion protein